MHQLELKAQFLLPFLSSVAGSLVRLIKFVCTILLAAADLGEE